MENAICLNNEGSYTCVCASGYTGDGFSSCIRNDESKKTIFIGVGVALAGLALIATAVIIIIVLACLMKRKKVVVTDNMAYLSNTHASSLIATSDLSPTIHTNTNEAYSLHASTNEACGIATATANEGKDIATFINDSYVATDVPTAPNQAYQAAKNTSSSNPLTNDYAYDYVPHTT